MKARLALALLMVSTAARAEEQFVTARLEWQRAADADECMDAESLERAVSARLGRNPFGSEQSHVTVKGRIATNTEPPGWIAELDLVSERGNPIGTRTLTTEAEHCSALDESLTLVLALMIDIPEEEVRRADRAREVPEPTAPPKPEPAPSRARTTPLALPRDVDAPRQPWRVNSGVFAAASVGLVPGLGLGAGLGLGIEPPRFWLTELDAIFWLPADAEQPGEGGARFRYISVGLFLCPIALRASPLRVDLCAGQRVGRFDADGFDFRQNRQQVRLTYSLGARARAWLRVVGPLRVGLGLMAEAPLARDKFFYTGADGRTDELFRMSPVALTGEAGLGLSFP
jgi:hypothetical protein